MVVALAVHHKVALVVAAGHQRKVAHVDGRAEDGVGVGIHLRSVPRVLHTACPLAAVRLCADGAQVAAYAHQCAGQAPGFGGAADHLHCVALAHTAHVQRHLRVGQIDRFGLLVNDKVVDIAVLGSGLQFLLRGQGVVGLGGVFLGGFAVVVPDAQHAAHGNVDLAAGQVVHLPRQLQHGEDAVIYLYRGFAGVFVDGLNVHNAVVVIVDIVELVVGDQILMQRLHLGVELFLALAVGDDLRHCVEHIIKDGGVPGQLLFGLAADQQAKAQHRRQQCSGYAGDAALHTVWLSFAALKAVCSSCKCASRSANIQLRFAGVTTALSGMVTCACRIRSSRVSTSLSRKFASTSAEG